MNKTSSQYLNDNINAKNSTKNQQHTLNLKNLNRKFNDGCMPYSHVNRQNKHQTAGIFKV